MATKLGISRNTYKNYEDGLSKDVPLHVALDILDVLGWDGKQWTTEQIRYLFRNQEIWSQDEYESYLDAAFLGRYPTNYIGKSHRYDEVNENA